MNKKITWINALTSGHMSCVMDPLHWETDRELLDICLPTIGLTEPEDAKLLWIKNTLQLSELECSEAYWDEAQNKPGFENPDRTTRPAAGRTRHAAEVLWNEH